MNPSGNVYFQDSYDTIFIVAWDTVDGIMDITTETRQPWVWGKEPEGYVKNHTLFKKGIVTIDRQAIRVINGQHVIIAEGSSQYIDFIQVSGNHTTDNFAYHHDHMLTEQAEIAIVDGPCWSDPDIDTNVWLWADVGTGGTEEPTAGGNDLVWGDVW